MVCYCVSIPCYNQYYIVLVVLHCLSSITKSTFCRLVLVLVTLLLQHSSNHPILFNLTTHQKPILLQGHTRSLTCVKFNKDGDLLFTCSKDHTPNVWFTSNGERLGTFNGHNGAVWSMFCVIKCIRYFIHSCKVVVHQRCNVLVPSTLTPHTH